MQCKGEIMTTDIIRDMSSGKRIAKGFMRGMGRMFDISGSYSIGVRYKYNTETSYAIDRDSLRRDLETIGQDVQKALGQYEKQYGKTR